jgi:hypothetical protein
MSNGWPTDPGCLPPIKAENNASDEPRIRLYQFIRGELSFVLVVFKDTASKQVQVGTPAAAIVTFLTYRLAPISFSLQKSKPGRVGHPFGC